jgi:hypothetical protein
MLLGTEERNILLSTFEAAGLGFVPYRQDFLASPCDLPSRVGWG